MSKKLSIALASNERALDFGDVEIGDIIIREGKERPAISPDDVNILHPFQRQNTDGSQTTFSGLPWVIANMPFTTVGMAKATRDTLVALPKNLTPHQESLLIEDLKDAAAGKHKNNIVLTAGLREVRDGSFFTFLERIEKESGATIDVINFDTPNAYSDHFIDAIRKLRAYCPNKIIISGNGVTAQAAQKVLEAGADQFKLGIGSGGHCETRRQAGTGIPQLSAVADTVSGYAASRDHVISDGGIRYREGHSDWALALLAGSSSVMVGSAFKDCREVVEEGVAGSFYTKDGQTWSGEGPRYIKTFGSAAAENHTVMPFYKAAEGLVQYVPYKQDLSAADIVRKHSDLLRQTLAQFGASNIQEFVEMVDMDATLRKARERMVAFNRTDFSFDEVSLVPKFPERIDTPLSRAEVCLNIATHAGVKDTARIISPLLFRAKDADSAIIQAEAYRDFYSQLVPQLQFKDENERLPSILVSADMSDADMTRVLNTGYQELWVETSLNKELSPALVSSANKIQGVLLHAGEKDTIDDIKEKVKSLKSEFSKAVVSVSGQFDCDDLEKLKAAGVHSVCIAADKKESPDDNRQPIQRMMAVAEKASRLGLTVLFDGYTNFPADSQKPFVFGADMVVVEANGQSHDSAFKQVWDYTGGLRSAITFQGGRDVHALRMAQCIPVPRLVNHDLA